MTTIEAHQTYETESYKFRQAWESGRKAAQFAHESVNSMVRILKRDNEDMTIRKILFKIAEDHNDLNGFSVQNLYRYLDEENSKMLQDTTVSERKQKVSKKDPPKQPTSEYYENTIKLQQEALEEERKKREQLEEAFHKVTNKQFVPGNKLQTEEDKIEDEYKKDMAAEPTQDLSSVIWKTGIADTQRVMESIQREIPKLRNRGWKTVEITMRAV